MRKWRAVLQHSLLLVVLSVLSGLTTAADKVPTVTAGTIERLPAFPSQYVTARNVDVWLPPGYPNAAPYAVLYMHDGQMLFDGAITWNRQEWQVDEIGSALIQSGKTRPFIVVGIWNAGAARASEYFPQRAFERLTAAQQQELHSFYADATGGNKRFPVPMSADRYLKFLVSELKPAIDARYASSRDRKDTMLMGSSMGGLISLYALAEYPAVFGAAGCLSTHWPGTLPDSADNPVPAAIFDYLRERLPAAGSHRLYFDHGTETLDASYAARQQVVDSILRQKGYSDANWRSLTFPGAEHNEQAWSARLVIPLSFLLGTERSSDAGPKAD
ncbi:alpha/beta hydrolase [Permianibacter sp. IMCC34836]|uniref:alpha/beta hydrolase n=1 Tax=Permianibacter fluminis TaxID=2738515 RepID=UPI001557DE76|nr:alpha/beta hydrolase-fold protein [Permianibacter fluminis]NQD37507.1 alpha/beta hydrolase [Permianibacter fluminis]